MEIGETTATGGNTSPKASSADLQERIRAIRERRRNRSGGGDGIVKNLPCPKCREKGGDSTGNHLMVFKGGDGYCSRCSIKFTTEQVKELEEKGDNFRRRRQERGNYRPNYEPPPTLEDVSFFGFLGDAKRGIAPSTDEHFGIRTETSKSNGLPLKRYYPYLKESDPYGYKVRKLPKDWDSAVGTIKGTDLFGWHLCKGKRRTLFITEGEEDAAAAWQLQTRVNKRSSNVRIKNQNPHVVSLPNGAKGAAEALMRHYNDLMKYETIYWFGDNIELDAEGANALEQAVRVLGVNKLKVPVYPDGKKDPCDILKIGGTEAIDAWATMFFEAKLYQPADIIAGTDMSLEEIEAETIKGIPLPACMSEVDRLLDGIRPYEHTLVFSGSGMGKSTLCRALGHYLCDEHDWMVGNIFLEEKKDKTSQGYIAYHNNIALNTYRKDFNSIPLEGRIAAKEKIIDKMFFLNHNGCIDPDVLMNKIRYLYNKGCKLIILDHISMVVTGSDDERKDIDYLMGEIYKFCENYPVHVISVVHLNRGESGQDFERGSEIRSKNLRGSSGLLQLCWNALALEGDNQHPEFSDARFARWLKVRETGNMGLAKGALIYNKVTGKFSLNTEVHRDDIGYGKPNYQKKADVVFDNKAA